LTVPTTADTTNKSHKSRTLPLNSRIIDALKPRAKKTGFVVYPDEVRGNTHYRVDPKKAFQSVAKKAGVPTVTTHVLRHTFGTQLAKAGISISKICEWMGHADVKTTMRYAHVQGYDAAIDAF
jgi:integrase